MTAIPVTYTKVVLPRRRADLLTRQRLIDLLFDLLDYQLLIVAAPAGYGKTSLLVDFAHQVESPVCWYSIDPLDQEPKRFLAHLIASIQQRFPNFGSRSSTALEAAGQSTPDVTSLASVIVNEIYEHIREHFLLVLDDYHLIQESKMIEEFINRFAQEVGENCHIILTSRTLLALPDMPLMVARSLVAGLSFEELAFRPEEIQGLVLQNYHQSMADSAARELAQETEGWITGLLLSAQAMWQGMADRVRVARVSRVGLYEYLAQQVLDQQPPELRDFLLRTSLLEEFDTALCSAVFGPSDDWPGMISAVLLNNLFVLPVGENGNWIRYHHLFRDFLQTRLYQQAPQEREAIMRRLVDVYAESGDWERAYAACRRLGDDTLTAGLVERAGGELIRSGRLITLAEWIDALPESQVDQRPNLLSHRAATASHIGKIDQALSLLDQAEKGLRASGDSPGLARSLTRRAIVYRMMGRYEAALMDANEALSLAQNDPLLLPVAAEALRAIGTAHYHLSHLQEADQNLQQALEKFQAAQDLQSVALVRMELGVCAMSAGQYRQAMQMYNQALQYMQTVNNTSRQANLLNNLGVLHQLIGEYEKAAQAFELALECARSSGYSRFVGYVLAGIGDLYAELDALPAAREAYEQAREAAQEVEDSFVLFYTDIARAGLERREGRRLAARQLLDATQEHAERSRSAYQHGLWQMESGLLALQEGQAGAAAQALAAAAALFESGGQRADEVRARMAQAEAERRDGKLPAALSALSQAIDKAGALESAHVLVRAGRIACELLHQARQNEALEAMAASLLAQIEHFENNLPGLRRRLRPHAASVPFTPPQLRIQTLGRGLVSADDHPVTAAEWQNQRKVREFFFYLLAHPEGVSKEALGLVFWPESSSAQLKLQFKNLIYRLRFALGQDVVLFENDRYNFNHSLDYIYDVEAFIDKAACAQREAQPARKRALYQDAISLYSGPYLPEVDGAWVHIERERLWQLFVDAALTLGRLLLDAGDFAGVIEICQRLLTEDACQEEAHRLMLRAYAALGNRAAMVRQFRRCQQALAEELGALPSPETEQLYRQLKA